MFLLLTVIINSKTVQEQLYSMFVVRGGELVNLNSTIFSTDGICINININTYICINIFKY